MLRFLTLATQPIHVEVVDRGGFDWASAGVGALAAVGLMLVGVGTLIAVRNGLRIRRKRDTSEATTRSKAA